MDETMRMRLPPWCLLETDWRYNEDALATAVSFGVRWTTMREDAQAAVCMWSQMFFDRRRRQCSSVCVCSFVRTFVRVCVACIDSLIHCLHWFIDSLNHWFIDSLMHAFDGCKSRRLRGVCILFLFTCVSREGSPSYVACSAPTITMLLLLEAYLMCFVHFERHVNTHKESTGGLELAWMCQKLRRHLGDLNQIRWIRRLAKLYKGFPLYLRTTVKLYSSIHTTN